MTVLMVTPPSFGAIDFLNALSASMKEAFVVVHPDTGERIKGEVLNLPGIGISWAKPKAPLGFPTGSDASDLETFEVQGILSFTPLPDHLLPKDAKEQAWELQIIDADDIDKFAPLAEAISKEFGVVVALNPYSKDDDSAHLEEVPANPNFPNGPKVCRVLRPVKL